MGVRGCRHSLQDPPSAFSSVPQCISNAFLQYSNKRGNSISSTVRPCEISFASWPPSVMGCKNLSASIMLCLFTALFSSVSAVNSRPEMKSLQVFFETENVYKCINFVYFISSVVLEFLVHI